MPQGHGITVSNVLLLFNLIQYHSNLSTRRDVQINMRWTSSGTNMLSSENYSKQDRL